MKELHVTAIGEGTALAVSDAQGMTSNDRTVDLLVCALNADDVLNAGDAVSARCICNSDVDIIDCDC